MLQIKVGETTAARRRVPLPLTEDGVAAWDGTVTGIKPQLSKNGAATAAATNDIVKLEAGVCYVELEEDEVDTAGFLIVSVTEDTGLAQCVVVVMLTESDPTVGNHSLAEIANAVNPTRAA